MDLQEGSPEAHGLLGSLLADRGLDFIVSIVTQRGLFWQLTISAVWLGYSQVARIIRGGAHTSSAKC